MRKYKLLVELPFLPKGSIYGFNDESGEVFRWDNTSKPHGFCEWPLQPGLAQYLWSLITDTGRTRILIPIK